MLDTLWLYTIVGKWNCDVGRCSYAPEWYNYAVSAMFPMLSDLYARCIYALNDQYDIITLFPRSDSWKVPDEPINTPIWLPLYSVVFWEACWWCRRLRSCLFCEGRISVLKRWFKTPIQNALHGSTCSCFPREEDDFVSMHCALFEAIVRAQVNRKGVYMTSFKRGYMWFCVHASTRISVLL